MRLLADVRAVHVFGCTVEWCIQVVSYVDVCVCGGVYSSAVYSAGVLCQEARHVDWQSSHIAAVSCGKTPNSCRGLKQMFHVVTHSFIY